MNFDQMHVATRLNHLQIHTPTITTCLEQHFVVFITFSLSSSFLCSISVCRSSLNSLIKHSSPFTVLFHDRKNMKILNCRPSGSNGKGKRQMGNVRAPQEAHGKNPPTFNYIFSWKLLHLFRFFHLPSLKLLYSNEIVRTTSLLYPHPLYFPLHTPSICLVCPADTEIYPIQYLL